jgi:predicted phage tail protein
MIHKLTAKSEAMELLIQSLESKLLDQDLEAASRREEEAEEADMLNEAAQLLAAVEADRVDLENQLHEREEQIKLLLKDTNSSTFFEVLKSEKEAADLKIKSQAEEIQSLQTTIDDLVKAADESESTMSQLEIQMTTVEQERR